MQDEILVRLQRLEFYQKLLFEMIQEDKKPLYSLIIKRNLSELEVEQFYRLCETLNKKWEIQKADEDEFVFYSPLYNEFKNSLHPALNVREVIDCCIGQNIYPDLMKQLKKNL